MANRVGEKLEELIKRDGMNQNTLAGKLGCTRQNIQQIISGRMRMSPQIAVKLERVFEYTASYWLALRSDDDLEVARQRLNNK